MQEAKRQNRLVIVTGSSRGIGRAIAEVLVEQGYDLLLPHRDAEEKQAERLEALRQHAQEAGLPEPNLLSIRCDLQEPGAAEAIAALAKTTEVPLYGLVNNAGITRDGLMMRMSQAQFEEVIDVDLVSPFNLTRAILPLLTKQRLGRIVNVASVVGLYGNAGQANYAAAKAGLIAMGKSLAREVARRNITVNAVAPGFIETDMTAAMPEAAREAAIAEIALGRLGQPRDIALCIAFLLSDAASYITGQVIEVAGGSRL